MADVYHGVAQAVQSMGMSIRFRACKQRLRLEMESAKITVVDCEGRTKEWKGGRLNTLLHGRTVGTVLKDTLKSRYTEEEVVTVNGNACYLHSTELDSDQEYTITLTLVKLHRHPPLGEPLGSRSFTTEWADHKTSKALGHLYVSVRAPYSVLEHCLAMIEALLLKSLKNFYFDLRGSVHKRVALKEGADLDIDVIIPRSWFSKEQVDEGLSKEDGRIVNIDVVSELCEDIANQLKKNGTPGITVEFPEEKCSRSLTFEAEIHGFSVEVDLFPKFVDKEGDVWGLSGKKRADEEGAAYRVWEKCVQSQLKNARKQEYSHSQEAAILFIKMWKKCGDDVLQVFQLCCDIPSLLSEETTAWAGAIEPTLEFLEALPVAVTNSLILIFEGLKCLGFGEFVRFASHDLPKMVADMEAANICSVSDVIKSFHVALAMERVILCLPDNDKHIFSEESSRDNPLFREEVHQLMWWTAEFLLAAYQAGPRDPQYCFEDHHDEEGHYNPFFIEGIGRVLAVAALDSFLDFLGRPASHTELKAYSAPLPSED